MLAAQECPGPWPFLLPGSSAPTTCPQGLARSLRVTAQPDSGPRAGRGGGGVDALLAIGPSPVPGQALRTELRAQERTSRVRRGRPPVSGYVDTLGFLVASLCPQFHYFLNYSAAAQCQRVLSQDKAHSHRTRKTSRGSTPQAGAGRGLRGQGETRGYEVAPRGGGGKHPPWHLPHPHLTGPFYLFFPLSDSHTRTSHSANKEMSVLNRNLVNYVIFKFK